jgi:hypothetical protein
MKKLTKEEIVSKGNIELYNIIYKKLEKLLAEELIKKYEKL